VTRGGPEGGEGSGEWLRRNWSRRQFLGHTARGAGVLLAGPLLAACAAERRQPTGGGGGSLYDNISSDSVVYADYGGETRAAREQAFFNSFTEETNVRVVTAEADPSRFQLMAERGNSEWDSMDTDGFDAAYFVDQGLALELPPEVERSDVVPEKFRDYATSGLGYSVLIGFLPDTFGASPPETWADFWDVTKFPGKRGFISFFVGAYEVALLADGVTPDQMYPIDVERAIAKLEELKSDIIFYESWAQGQQLLAQGGVSMVAMPHQRVLQLENLGTPVEAQWNQAVYFSWTGNMIPKGAPHPDAAFALVDWMQDAERQAEFSRLSLVAPNNSKALEFMDADLAAKMPNTPDHLAIAVEADQEAIAAQRVELNDAYTRFLAG
jgi:putative spermidine/putrescine transport system substrate-binding protein